MNDYREFRSVTDWWSRLIALGSLIIASAALYFAYLQDHGIRLPGVTDTAQRSVQEPVRSAEGEGAPLTLQKPIADVPESSEPSPGMTATKDNGRTTTPSSENEIDWSAISQRREEGESPPGAATPNEATERADSALDDLIAQPNSTRVPQPHLLSVTTALRPTGKLDQFTAIIRNDGDGVAAIRELIFAPARVDEIPVEASRRPNWGPSDEEQLVVTFDIDDNRTTTQGRHGVYARQLAAAYWIEPNSSAAVRLVLENEDYIGWSLAGKLTLKLDNGEDFSIDEVIIPFVAP